MYLTHSEENLDTSEMGMIGALAADQSGKLTPVKMAWHTYGFQGGFASPVIDAERLYQMDNGAVLGAFELATGKKLWERPLGTIQKASPVIADGKLYVGTENEAGRCVVPATVEFRLPDGSVHPHLLLAGVAQAMLAGREDAQRDAVLDRSRGASAGAPAAKAAGADAVPRSFQEVGTCLGRDREVFEHEGVFPRTTIDAALKTLGWAKRQR